MGVAGIAVMPFWASLTLLLLAPSILMAVGDRSSFPKVRVPHWAVTRLRLNMMLLYVALAEFWALMLISTLWPDALNWW